MGENLLLTASSSKLKEEGKKKEIKGKEGERNSSFQHDNKRHDREKGAEKLLLQSPPSKPSRRQAAAVVMFLCLTFFAIHSFLLNPMFLKTIIFKMSEMRKKLHYNLQQAEMGCRSTIFTSGRCRQFSLAVRFMWNQSGKVTRGDLVLMEE